MGKSKIGDMAVSEFFGGGRAFNEASLAEANKNKRAVPILFEKIVPNEGNFYETSDINSLAATIADKGLLEPLAVTKEDDGTYKIISGHRRFLAISQLREQGGAEAENWDEIPCYVLEGLTEAEKGLYLLIYNQQRVKSDADLVNEVEAFRNYLKKAKNEGVAVSGRLNDLIAKMCGVAPRTVARAIEAASVVESGRELLNEGKITMGEAATISKLPAAEQEEIFTSGVDVSVVATEVQKKIAKTQKTAETKKIVEEVKVKLAGAESISLDGEERYRLNIGDISGVIEKVNSLESTLDNDAVFSPKKYTKIIEKLKACEKEIAATVTYINKG